MNEVVNESIVKSASLNIPKTNGNIKRYQNFPAIIRDAFKNRNYWAKIFKIVRDESPLNMFKKTKN
jgi:hypothetical protein